MVLTLGEPVGKYLIEMPKTSLTDSVPGKHYHIRIETEGITNAEEVAKLLVNGLWNKFHADVKYIRIDNSCIDIQLEGSPFVWAVLLLWLPQILVGVGVILTAVVVFSIISAIPSWAWATLGLGIILIVFGPVIGKAVLTSEVR